MRNPVLEKSFLFAMKVVILTRVLREEKKEFVLSRQLLKSGTSIGANVEEALGASSKRDFINKMIIAHKESRETSYWLRLVYHTEIINKTVYDELYLMNEELIRLLVSIIKTSKQQP
jgi:four helix bundle protein